MENNKMEMLLVGTDDLKNAAPLQHKKKLIRLCLWILMLAVALVIFMISTGIDGKRNEIERSLQQRMEVLARGRIDVVSTWLAGISAQGNRVINSDLFRLYAAEIELFDGDIGLLLSTQGSGQGENGSELQALAEQLPMMRNLLQEFAEYSDFVAARIINRSGQSYISTKARSTALSHSQKEEALIALNSNQIIYSPAEVSGDGLIMHIYLPILAPPISDSGERPVAVLQLSKNISTKINEILSTSPLLNEGEQTKLLQYQKTGAFELIPWLPDALIPLAHELNADLSRLMDIRFDQRADSRQQRQVYSLAFKIPELNWWIMQESDPATALAALTEYKRFTISLILLGSLLFLVLIGALWWRLVGVEQQKIAAEFKQLANQIEEQRRLLDSINGNLSEYIALKDNKGIYRYVNPAFAAAVGKERDNIVGLDDSAIFGYATAQRLAHSDRFVMENHRQIIVNEEIYLQSLRYELQISKVPYIDGTGKLAGVISSYRDITAIQDSLRKSERATRQTIEVLARTTERVDPYLAGHSRLMSRFAVETAKALNCSKDVIETVKTASYLSQIGKIFLSPDLLQKPGILTDAEKKEVEKHVEHAARILDEIEFELPIYETLMQMNENLDGSGYPAGLDASQISEPARILATVNSFCAMVRPRSYRSSYPPEEIFNIMEQAEQHYDLRVVTALKEIANSPIGEKLLDED
jgi:PAS domain S-box-containing protein